MKSQLEGISTIIFDLGGVVLNLDPDQTADAFAKLADRSKPEIYKIFLGQDWAPDFERGKITASAFRDAVRTNLHIDVDDDVIDHCWNAMLLDLPMDRMALISRLRPKYQTLVLSNTNEIHITAFDTIVSKASNGRHIGEFFDFVHYSHHLGMRKPDLEIYEEVLARHNLQPESTLFIDDMAPNIKAAQSTGIKTLHLTDQNYLFELFA